MDYDIKIFTNLDLEIKEYWQKLEKNCHCYCFQSYDWFQNWFNCYRKNNKDFNLNVVAVLNKNEIFCILPLEIKNYGRLKILQWASNKLTDYNSPILSENFKYNEKIFKDLWKKIVKASPKFDLIYLQRQPKNIEKCANPFVDFLKNYKQSKYYYISLPKSWKKYSENVLKKKFLNDNLRSKRLLKKIGKIKYRVEKDKKEKIKYIDDIIKQKNTRLISQGTNIIFNERDINFYKGFENMNLNNIKTHTSALIMNNEIISMNWGILHKKRYYYLLPSMKNGNFEKYSPGKLLISILIKWSISKKFKIFDFALGEETYKKRWSNESEYLYAHLQLKSIKGIFYYFINIIKLSIKKLVRFK